MKSYGFYCLPSIAREIVDQKCRKIYIFTKIKHATLTAFDPCYTSQINDLPKPSYMNKTLSELKIGTYDNIETANEDTSIIVALKKFVERRVSALPIIDTEGRLVDIYAKFDVIVSIYHSCPAL
jgi:CBS domain-containing protein